MKHLNVGGLTGLNASKLWNSVHISSVSVSRSFLSREAHATHTHSAVCVMARYLSVHHKLVFCWNGCIRVGSRHRGYHPLVLHYVLMEFVQLQKEDTSLWYPAPKLSHFFAFLAWHVDRCKFIIPSVHRCLPHVERDVQRRAIRLRPLWLVQTSSSLY